MRVFYSLFVFLLMIAGVSAQESGSLRILPSGTSLVSDGYSVTLTLSLSRPAAFKVFTLDNPKRLIIDLGDTDFMFMPSGLSDGIDPVSAVRFGYFNPQQSRIILDLAEPFTISTTEQIDNLLTVTLSRSSDAEFALMAGLSDGSLRRSGHAIAQVEGQSGLPLVALDAGHGGIDPGAVRGDISEKQVTLLFAGQLRDRLLATGRYRVLMTRDDDNFVSLTERIRLARASGVDIFISLHANTVERGNARGTTVYNLSDQASNDEAAIRAEFENRSDIVAGAVLFGQDDQLAQILIEMAQRQTNAGSVRFADTLGSTIRFALDKDAPSRRLAAGFRVLRSIDTPSVLIELGFMSNTTDLANLMSRTWRSIANQAIIAALDEWFIIPE